MVQIPLVNQNTSSTQILNVESQAILDSLLELDVIPETEFADAFQQVITLIEKNFRDEEAFLEISHPRHYKFHLTEHATVLQVLHNVFAQVLSGQVECGRYLARLLHYWFIAHFLSRNTLYCTALRHAQEDHYFVPTFKPDIEYASTPLMAKAA